MISILEASHPSAVILLAKMLLAGFHGVDLRLGTRIMEQPTASLESAARHES